MTTAREIIASIRYKPISMATVALGEPGADAILAALTALASKVAEMEAENALLRGGREFWKRVSDGWSQRAEVYKARLAEALKALDDLADLSAPGWSSDARLQLQQAVQILNQAREKAAHAARRIREGGKVDG